LSFGLFVLTGCEAGPETEYGSSEGKSLNGTSVLSAILSGEGHEIEPAIRLNDDLADWAEGMIRFAPYPGPPDREEANWYATWLAADSSRWLIYVVGDFDSSPEYWRSVVEDPAWASEHHSEDEARQALRTATDGAQRVSPKSATPADASSWFEVDSAWQPPRTCTSLSGPWAEDVDAAAATLILHEPLESKEATLLLAGDGKPFVIEKSFRGESRLLVIANGSFLLNEALVNPARAKLLTSLLDWIGPGRSRIALVEGAFVLGGPGGPPSLSELLRQQSSFRWIAIQIALAAIVAALARAPRLGRPRDEPGLRADRPAAHAEALGSLLARTRSAERARELVSRYRHWRHPRTQIDHAARVMPAGSLARRSAPAGQDGRLRSRPSAVASAADRARLAKHLDRGMSERCDLDGRQ
jgi:hypothetical protein